MRKSDRHATKGGTARSSEARRREPRAGASHAGLAYTGCTASELEQRVERGPGVAGVALVGLLGELLGRLGGEERALVAGALLEDLGRDLLEAAALPAHGGVEGDAIGAGVEVRAAAGAGGVEGDLVEERLLFAALG